MYSTRNLSIISNLILLILLAISFYHGIISPPPIITFTTDENFIGESGIFLLFGITPRALEWAAIPSTLIAYLIFILWCGFSLLKNLSSINGLPDILTIIDKNAFYYLNHREEFVIWERWIQIILIGFIIYKTIQFILKSKHPVFTQEIKLILTILCVCSEVIWISVPLIRPEALSGSLYLYLNIRLLFTEKITPKISATLLIIFIFIFTQRLIFISFTPFVLGSILINLWHQKISWKTYLNYLGIVVLVLLALMPFIITDTFVVLKSFLGGVFTKINHDKMDTYFNMSYINNFIQEPINILFSLFCVIGTWFFIKRHSSKFISILFILNFLFILFSSLKAAQLYNTHTFPMSMMAIILIAFGISGIISFIKEDKRIWVLGVLCLFLFTNTLWVIYNNKRLVFEQQQNLADAISWIKSLNKNEKILLALDFDGLIPKNKQCLMREYEANASEVYRMDKLSKLLKMPVSDSLSKFTLPILAQSFAFEDEKLFDIQYQIALKYINTDSTKRFDTDYFFKNNNNMSHCYVQNEALKRFNEGNYRYIVSHEQIPNLKPIKSFLKGGGEIFWAYEFKIIKN
jgi:hypothetical protein